MPKINLSSNNRILITGKTGSGKTYLARYITRTLKRLVVLDGKGTLSNWNLEPWNSTNYKRLLSGENVRLRAVPPIKDVAEFWDDVLMKCYTARNITIYIDEMYAVNPPNQKASDILWACYTRGRELGLGVWASTQRPVWIPLFALSEAEHYFVFRLSLSDDRARMAAFCGQEVMNSITDEHGFYYSQAAWDKPIYIKRLVGDSIVHTTPTNPTPTKKLKERQMRHTLAAS